MALDGIFSKKRAGANAAAGGGAVALRHPAKGDGKAVSRLIASCPPLETNSLYCTLLQCAHFSRSCMLAERDGQIVGWISGYPLPEDPTALFIWQIAVDASMRGQGLGKALVEALLADGGFRRLEATIALPNKKSWALFRSIAEKLEAPLVAEEWARAGRDLPHGSESEHLVIIGPIKSGKLRPRVSH